MTLSFKLIKRFILFQFQDLLWIIINHAIDQLSVPVQIFFVVFAVLESRKNANRALQFQ